MKDLIVLTACKDGEYALRGLLSRPEAMGIASISVEYLQHPNKDPGCLKNPGAILRSQARLYRYALVIFDREGSGDDTAGAGASLEKEVEEKLNACGWSNRARAVVIEPELETWVWSTSTEVDSVLGWTGRNPHLRDWLRERGLFPAKGTKPARPKEAMASALREARRPWSARLFEHLGQRVSVKRCEDESFARLLSILRNWFPV